MHGEEERRHELYRDLLCTEQNFVNYEKLVQAWGCIDSRSNTARLGENTDILRSLKQMDVTKLKQEVADGLRRMAVSFFSGRVQVVSLRGDDS